MTFLNQDLLFAAMLIALTSVCAAQPAQNPGRKQWTVWHEECPVFATTNLDEDTTPLTRLKQGDFIDGMKYFRNADDVEWIAFRYQGEIAYAPFAWLTHVPAQNRADSNLAIGQEIVDRWNGLEVDYEPDDLVSIPSSYCYTQTEFRLRAEAWDAAQHMIDDARSDGVQIWIASAYRSYNWQRSKYLRKIKSEGLGQRVSAKPGHSEHQLGVTVDMAGSDPKQVLEQEFGDSKEGKWIKENCERYGFRLTYTKDTENETGYISEPWHLRYLGIKGSG